MTRARLLPLLCLLLAAWATPPTAPSTPDLSFKFE